MKKIISLLMAIMMAASIMAVASLSVSAAGVCPSTAKEYNGHTYNVYKGSYTWEWAKKYCENQGGHLATITSQKENNFVTKLIANRDFRAAWIGGSDVAKEGTWKWTTGEKFNYANWNYGEPTNSNETEHYLGVYKDGTWNDFVEKTDTIEGFVCEWDCTKKVANSTRFASTKVTVNYGATKILKLLNNTKTVKWSTSNKKIATVSSKGVVTGKALGSAYITAQVGSKNYKCKVTVTQADYKASVSFKVSDGGYFILGSTKIKCAFKINSGAAAKVTVNIVNADNESVYKKTFTNVKKKAYTSFYWNGKDNDGSLVPSGSYRMKVTIGKKNSYSSYLSAKRSGDFASGNGAKTNPFIVKTEKQFRNIVKYPNAYFKQTANLDFDYEAVGGFFSADQPFNGVYDGNGKTIANISTTKPIFDTISKDAQIKNINFDSCTLKTKLGGIIASVNYGKITNCTTEQCIVASSDDVKDKFNGMLVGRNYGYVSDCVAEGLVSSNGDVCYTGGVVGHNTADGKIISCTSNINVTSYTGSYYIFIGGVVGMNSGLVRDCEASGIINRANVGAECYIGSIAGNNGGQIVECYYTGESAVNISGKNTGTIM